jgi:hypothetical protein
VQPADRAASGGVPGRQRSALPPRSCGPCALHAPWAGEEPLLLIGARITVPPKSGMCGGPGASNSPRPSGRRSVLADEDESWRRRACDLSPFTNAVGFEILDDELRTLARDADMARRDRRVGDHDRVVRQATDGHRGRV